MVVGFSVNYQSMLMNRSMAYLKPFDFNTLKKSHWKGTFHRQTDTRTSRLLDQLGPEGRVGEKYISLA